MKTAVEDYAKIHCLCKARDELKAAVSKDLDLMHYSSTMPEFKAKVKAVLDHWHAAGYVAATMWKDKQGRMHNLAAYFTQEWLVKAP